MNQLEKMRLEVLPNNCAVKEPCPICGTWDRPEAPYWIFLDGNLGKPVCYGCAEKHEPNLLKVVCGANTNHWQDNELRRHTHEVELSNQQILEFAYLTKELIELCMKDNAKLFFEQANCYLACYYTVRELLKLADSIYVESHNDIFEFYRKDRVLSNDNDRLHWEAVSADVPF